MRAGNRDKGEAAGSIPASPTLPTRAIGPLTSAYVIG